MRERTPRSWEKRLCPTPAAMAPMGKKVTGRVTVRTILHPGAYFSGGRKQPTRGNKQWPSPHYARDAVARSWRWSCHWATIPRYRGTAPEAYLFSTSQGELVLLVPPVPSSSRGACRGEPVEGTPEDAQPPAVKNGTPEAGMVCPRSVSGTGAKSASGASTFPG